MKSWKQHKIECPLLKKIYPRELPDAAKMLMRLLIRLDQGGDYVRGYYTHTDYRKFSDLMSRKWPNWAGRILECHQCKLMHAIAFI